MIHFKCLKIHFCKKAVDKKVLVNDIQTFIILGSVWGGRRANDHKSYPHANLLEFPMKGVYTRSYPHSPQ